MSNDPIDAEFTATNTAVTTPAQTTALTITTENPYERMALIAMESGRGMEQLGQFMELQMKWEANRAHKAYTAAMAAFKAEPIRIIKDKLVEFTTRDGDTTSYRHARLANVVDAVVGGLGKHGLSHRWDVDQTGQQIKVTCTITHRDGHSESVSMSAAPDASGKKNQIQQVASTVTYLQRYTLMALCGVASSDMQDDDGQGYDSRQVEYVSDEQLSVLTDLVDAYLPQPGKRADFLSFLSKNTGHAIDSLGSIPADQFNYAHEQLRKLAAKKTKAPEAGNAAS
jgi:hypothetical protein